MSLYSSRIVSQRSAGSGSIVLHIVVRVRMRMTCARRADRELLCPAHSTPRPRRTVSCFIRVVQNALTVVPFCVTVTFPAPEQLLTSTAGGCTAAVGRRREIPPRLRKFQVRFARAPS